VFELGLRGLLVWELGKFFWVWVGAVLFVFWYLFLFLYGGLCSVWVWFRALSMLFGVKLQHG